MNNCRIYPGRPILAEYDLERINRKIDTFADIDFVIDETDNRNRNRNENSIQNNIENENENRHENQDEDSDENENENQNNFQMDGFKTESVWSRGTKGYTEYRGEYDLDVMANYVGTYNTHILLKKIITVTIFLYHLVHLSFFVSP